MAKYIVAFDKSIHPTTESVRANLALLNGTIVKEFNFGNTYEIEIPVKNITKLTGVLHSEKSNKMLNAKMEYNIDHLIDIVNIPGENNSWNPINTGYGEIIYLVDTGVNYHDENPVLNNLYTAYADFEDRAGHGTAVASLINGANIGVSPGAIVKNVKLFETTSGAVSVGDIIDAFNSILEDHLLSDDTLKVICMPWTIEKNFLVDSKLSELMTYGLLPVCAAGNDASNVDDTSPAGLNPVLTVASYNKFYQVEPYNNLPFTSGTPSSSIASEADMAIDVFALGANICAADANNPSGYVISSGTSLSAGLVAGAAAQWMSEYPEYSAEMIRSILTNEGRPDGEAYLDFSIIGAPSGTRLDISSVSFSLISVPKAQQLARPSGRIVNVKYSEDITVDLELNDNASDVQVTEYCPLSPWMEFDSAAGIVAINTSAANNSIAPGVYNFNITGKVNGVSLIEEYSVGVFTEDETELNSAPEYYYDPNTTNYEQVVTFQSASFDPNVQQKN